MTQTFIVILLCEQPQAPLQPGNVPCEPFVKARVLVVSNLVVASVAFPLNKQPMIFIY